MSADMPVDGAMGGREPAAPAVAPREVIYRHKILVRLTHWVNALTIVLLIGTGLNIFNAHPHLYWGGFGSELDHAWLSLNAAPGPHGSTIGETVIGPLHFNTTGLLGWSKVNGQWTGRGWPDWITVPSYTDLADARTWHFFLAWVLVVNGLVYLLWSFLSRHVQRDLWPTLADLRDIPRSAWQHLQNKHPTGEEAKRYNVLQRLAYLGLILLVAGMIFTGLTMSPGIDAAAPWLLELFGGRQSARSLHFLFATGVFLFIVVHLAQVVLAGPINETLSMITGLYAVPRPHHDKKAD